MLSVIVTYHNMHHISKYGNKNNVLKINKYGQCGESCVCNMLTILYKFLIFVS